MNASDVIRMRQQIAILKGRDGNVQKAYGVMGLCDQQPGCCFDCSDTAVGYAASVGAGSADLVYQGGVFFGCKKPTVVAMTTQAPLICPQFVETDALDRDSIVPATSCKCPTKCPPATTQMTTQPPVICPVVVLDTPLE